MINAEIKKGKGIDELLSGYGGQAETERSITTKGESHISELMGKYEKTLHARIDTPSMFEDFVRGKNTIDDVLIPDEINAFLQITVQNEKHPAYSHTTGLFISRLIQNSYEAGQNQFHLNTTYLKGINYLAAYIKADEGRPLEITITGNTGDLCGLKAKNSTFNIQGNTGSSCGRDSDNSTFNITGNTGNECGLWAKHSTFRTPNKETLERMEKDVPKGNRIMLIDGNGNEHIVRDYHDKR